MKILLTLIGILFISLPTFAQQGINYKALIKDDLGNVLVNANIINVQFIIYEGAALTNPVYLETHPNASTDANGIIILNIGNGTTTDVFTDIVWGNNEHWLDVKIDIGAGLVDVSTTQFMAVPYAKHAITAGNVSGLERITERTGPSGNPLYGWRLIGKEPLYYGNVGYEGVDLSTSNSNSTTRGAIGDFSTAMGFRTTASGFYSTAMGGTTTSSGFYSTAMGFRTTAPSYAETVIGHFNTGYTHDSSVAWDNDDRLFVIGNGSSSSNPNNALTVLKNGNAKFDGEIQHTSTGNANLIPIAYGSVNGAANPSIVGGTGNFTVSRNSTTNEYTINVTDQSLDLTNTVASVVSNTSNFRTVNVTYSGGNMIVHIFIANGTKVASPFQFTIYKL